MKFKITESVFFYGKQRQPGEEMEAPVGPYRQVVVPGGLRNIPQFVELPTEIHMADPVTPPPASFAEATASVLKPTAAAPKTIASGAKKLSDLAKQRLAFNDDLNKSIETYSQKLADAGTKKSAVFSKAHAAVDDEIAGFESLDNALTEFEGANSSPLSS